VLYRVRGGIDERDRVGTDRDHRERAMVWRKPHTMDQQLTAIERAHVTGRRVAKLDQSEELVVRRIDNGNGVRKLIRSVEAVAVTDGDVRSLRSSRNLARERLDRKHEKHERYEAQLHITSPSVGEAAKDAATDAALARFLAAAPR